MSNSCLLAAWGLFLEIESSSLNRFFSYPRFCHRRENIPSLCYCSSIRPPTRSRTRATCQTLQRLNIGALFCDQDRLGRHEKLTSRCVSPLCANKPMDMGLSRQCQNSDRFQVILNLQPTFWTIGESENWAFLSTGACTQPGKYLQTPTVFTMSGEANPNSPLLSSFALPPASHTGAQGSYTTIGNPTTLIRFPWWLEITVVV